MIDFVFGTIDAVFQLVIVFGGLLFAGIGAVVTFYPLWQRLFAVSVKARIVALYMDHPPETSQPVDDVVKKTPKSSIAAFIVILVISLPLAGGAGYFIKKFYDMKETGVRIEAQVVSYVEVPDSDGGSPTYAPVVRFMDQSGVVREEREGPSSSNQPFNEGQDVIVYYNPADPSDFIIDDFWHNMIWPAILGGFALFAWFMYALSVLGGNSSGRKTVGRLYYPEFEYFTPDGRMVRAQTGEGTSWLSGRMPGTERVVYLSKDDYDRPTEVSFIASIFGLLFLAPGIFILYQTVPELTFGWPLLIAFVGMIAIIFIKAQSNMSAESMLKLRREFTNYMQGKKKIRLPGLAEKKGVLLSQADLDMLIEQHDRSLKRWAPLHLLICAGMIYGGWYLHQSQTAFERQALKAEGEVVRMIAERSDDSTVYYPLISYVTMFGVTIQFKDSVGSSPPSFQQGNKVDVLYVADDPRGAIVDRGWLNQAPGIGLMVLGGLFLILLAKGLNSAFGRKVRHN